MMKTSPLSLTPSRTAIILFCLWHMAAIGLYALPSEAHDPLTETLRSHALPIVRPYVLLTSQWQQWNLFSPNPLRRVTTYRIEVDRDGKWEALRTLNAESFGFLRHATEYKNLSRILEGGEQTLPLIEHFLQRECTDADLPAGTHVRLMYDYYVLPRLTRSASVREWRDYVPAHTVAPGSEVLCGWPAGTGIDRPFDS